MKKLNKILLLPICMLLFACAGEVGADRYETSAAGQVNSADTGVVLSVRQVIIEDTKGSVGKIGGSVAGGAAGSMIGGSPAVRVIGAVGGAIVGGIAGGAAQNKLSEQKGLEYIIRLDSGRVVTITQGMDNVLSSGQRCVVLGARGGERARVVPY